jgi:hypothetical protein
MTDLRLYALEELGSDGYPPEWHRIIKHQVRHDANHRCIRCQHPYRNGEHGSGEWSACDTRCTHYGPFRHQLTDGTWIDHPQAQGINPYLFAHNDIPVEALWRILTVHHLDGNKANCRWWNLVALCQRCHLEIQGRVVMDRVWPHEHTAWFRPYVAGYYAHRFLQEDVTREQAEARLEELLGLEVRQMELTV